MNVRDECMNLTTHLTF